MDIWSVLEEIARLLIGVAAVASLLITVIEIIRNEIRRLRR
jgi:hypothetical protein